MNFILGYITGIVTAILVFLILTFFRSAIERRIKIIESQISNAGPRSKGDIYMPKDEVDISREEIIKRNREIGKDTNFSELR
jgi:hypothetical protein